MEKKELMEPGLAGWSSSRMIPVNQPKRRTRKHLNRIVLLLNIGLRGSSLFISRVHSNARTRGNPRITPMRLQRHKGTQRTSTDYLLNFQPANGFTVAQVGPPSLPVPGTRASRTCFPFVA